MFLSSEVSKVVNLKTKKKKVYLSSRCFCFVIQFLKNYKFIKINFKAVKKVMDNNKNNYFVK